MAETFLLNEIPNNRITKPLAWQNILNGMGAW